jgi:hypothetical protein
MAGEEVKNLQNRIFILANLLVFTNAMMFRAASEPSRWTFELTVIYWIIFVAAEVSVNTWLYFTYLKKKNKETKLR